MKRIFTAFVLTVILLLTGCETQYGKHRQLNNGVTEVVEIVPIIQE